MKNRDSFISTSTPRKIELDEKLATLISITRNQHVIMLVGAPDGLRRHYDNMLKWGGDLRKLTIIDCIPGVIKRLETYHDQELKDFPKPRFVTSDLNELLETWPDNKPIGVIDFDGTTGLSEYHLDTLKHAERLRAKYVIMVASARIQDPAIKSFAAGMSHIKRLAFVPKSEQLKTRGKYNKAYATKQWSLRTVNEALNVIAFAWGWKTLYSAPYKGVTPMTCALYERTCKPDLEALKSDAVLRGFNYLLMESLNDPGKMADLFDSQAYQDLKAEAAYFDAAMGVDNQFRYIKTDEFKDLIKQPKHKDGERFMQFNPTDDWWMRYKPNEFKIRHPERFNAIRRQRLPKT